VKVRESGRGPVRLVLLHGFTGTGASFEGLALDDRFTVVAPDLPGHGQSDPATSWDDCLRALEPLVTPQTVLAGYSMGARLALALALRKEPARLLLESGSPGIASEPDRQKRRADDEAQAALLEERGLLEFLERWDSLPLLSGLLDLPLPAREALRARRLTQTAAGLASALRALGAGAQPSLWTQLQRLSVPTQLVAGERDPKYAALARQMAALLPRASVHLIAGSGHTPHLERPLEFAALVNAAGQAAAQVDGGTP